jgi:hypothetical protein
MSGEEQMKPAAPGVKLTYEDFLLFPGDGNGTSSPLSKIFEN